MLHVSTVLPAPLAAGPSGAPDDSKCWHCHTNNNGTVTAFSDGQFHAALTSYRATPGRGRGALPAAHQRLPRLSRLDSPGRYRPEGGGEPPGDGLWRQFTGSAQSPASPHEDLAVDCSTCHKSPGSTWNHGKFHPKVAAAVPQDCVSCHYMAMADAAKADVKSGTNFTMKHGSPQLTFQGCQTCHPSALSKAATTPVAADALGRPAHSTRSIGKQPSTCLECHAVSQPAAGASTQSTVTYTLSVGATASNGAQWMNHGSGRSRQGLRRLSCRRRQGVRQRLEQVGFVPRRGHEGQHLPGVPRPHERRRSGGRYQEQSPGRLDQTMPTTAPTGSSTGIPAGTLAQMPTPRST